MDKILFADYILCMSPTFNNGLSFSELFCPPYIKSQINPFDPMNSLLTLNQNLASAYSSLDIKILGANVNFNAYKLNFVNFSRKKVINSSESFEAWKGSPACSNGVPSSLDVYILGKDLTINSRHLQNSLGLNIDLDLEHGTGLCIDSLRENLNKKYEELNEEAKLYLKNNPNLSDESKTNIKTKEVIKEFFKSLYNSSSGLESAFSSQTDRLVSSNSQVLYAFRLVKDRESGDIRLSRTKDDFKKLHKNNIFVRLSEEEYEDYFDKINYLVEYVLKVPKHMSEYFGFINPKSVDVNYLIFSIENRDYILRINNDKSFGVVQTLQDFAFKEGTTRPLGESSGGIKLESFDTTKSAFNNLISNFDEAQYCINLDDDLEEEK